LYSANSFYYKASAWQPIARGTRRIFSKQMPSSSPCVCISGWAG